MSPFPLSSFPAVVAAAAIPKFGWSDLATILTAVLLPMPLMPSMPLTWPKIGTGRLNSEKPSLPNRCIGLSVSFSGSFTMWIAPNGHFLTVMLSASVQTSSFTWAFPSGPVTKTSLPILFPGLTLMQRYPPQPCGLHFSFSMTAMRRCILPWFAVLYLNSRLQLLGHCYFVQFFLSVMLTRQFKRKKEKLIEEIRKL